LYFLNCMFSRLISSCLLFIVKWIELINDVWLFDFFIISNVVTFHDINDSWSALSSLIFSCDFLWHWMFLCIYSWCCALCLLLLFNHWVMIINVLCSQFCDMLSIFLSKMMIIFAIIIWSFFFVSSLSSFMSYIFEDIIFFFIVITISLYLSSSIIKSFCIIFLIQLCHCNSL